MKAFRVKAVIAIFVAFVVLFSGNAWAARKQKDNAAEDAAKAAAELAKTLEPLNKTLEQLSAKSQAHALFSPEDAGKLGKIKYQLLDLIYAHPKDDQLARPVYQAAVLYSDREEYHDAYELFGYVSERYPKTPYAMKSKMKIGELQRMLGSGYFPSEDSEKTEPAKTDKKPGKAEAMAKEQ